MIDVLGELVNQALGGALETIAKQPTLSQTIKVKTI